MYQIYIVEDNCEFSKKIVGFIDEYCCKNFNFGEVDYFITNEDFISSLDSFPKSSSLKNIYILDIMLESEINGIQIANEIRKTDVLGYIIFLTSRIEYTKEPYNYTLKALNFIDKGCVDFKNSFFKSLDRVYFENKCLCKKSPNRKEINFLTFSYQSCHYKINVEDIFYIEKLPLRRVLGVYSEKDVLYYPISLVSLLEKLPSSFIKCHKSIIINTNQIRKIEKEHDNFRAFFRYGLSCLVSKKYLSDVSKLMNTQS